MEHPVILFDGVCNLCSASVQWIIRHDPKSKFRFTSLQSKTGEVLKNKYRIPANADSVILIEDGKVYLKSGAALRIAGKCKGLWPLLKGFLIVPAFIRNGVYDFIARNRYKWFGKKEVCWLPSPDLKARFL